ncbi:methyltransferase domain-containing protein, partial [Fulvivirga sp. RKSG066]|uniref:class I SAM-dependent methyltransferase n=1 Tax=Fulvivirga aurantia TaxID=2529383 RepID=UPI0012BB8E59
MELKRRRLQGVLNILSFNRHFYIIGLLVLAILILLLSYLSWPLFWIWILVGAFGYGLIAPLLVSAYVYDLSGYYNFDWLAHNNISQSNPKHIANINAGFDETSFILKSKFPETEISVFDFYNSENHTEPAIVRARKVSAIYPGTKSIESNSIPCEDESLDLIFLLSSAHEIRSYAERVSFLKECKRVLKSSGKVITVEHLRDIPNFLAFSIGFTHFFSRREWMSAFNEA